MTLTGSLVFGPNGEITPLSARTTDRSIIFQNHTNRPLTDFGGKTSIFSHPVYLFLREFSLQDSRGGSATKS